MQGFLYFLSGASGGIVSHERMKAAGLGYAFPRENGECPTVAWESVGPENRHGLMVAYGDDPRRTNPTLKYDSESQVWVGLSEGVWLGYASDPTLRPSAYELRRRVHTVEGYPIELGDGNTWTIPIVRRFPDGTALPQVLVCGPDGTVVPQVKKEYEELFNFALSFQEELFGVGQKQMSPDILMRYGVLALQVNYRVSAAEVSALQLIDTDNIKRIAEAIIDWPNLKKFADEFKKKASAESKLGQTLATGASESVATVPHGPKSISMCL